MNETQWIFEVQCRVNGEWVPLIQDSNEAKAMEVADFMRSGQPQPGLVRIEKIIHNGAK